MSVKDVHLLVFSLCPSKNVQQRQQPEVERQQAATIDITEQIKRLGELRDQELLTEQNLIRKKQEALARM
jgi:hypothetical protein